MQNGHDISPDATSSTTEPPSGVSPIRLSDARTRARVRSWLDRVANRAETRRALDRLRAVNSVDDVVTLLLSVNESARTSETETATGSPWSPPWERQVVGELVVDPATGEVTLRGESIALEPIERALLEYLVIHRDRVVGREELLRCIWGGARFRSRVADAYVGRLRNKLEGTSLSITTVRAAGYRLVASSPEAGEA